MPVVPTALRATRACVAASVLACVIAMVASRPALAQDSAILPGIVTTHHQVTVGGKVLRYTARAAHIPIRDNESGDVHANLFFISYTLDRNSKAPARPLTFLWNGGPGSNSGLVHLLGFGPKRITQATGNMPRYSPSGTALVDNQETWLTMTDLVFVDPIGTGYSRPTKPEFVPEFYQGPGDADAVAEFIRVYRTRFEAYDAPLFLMGESYGVTRCALVAGALERRRTKVAGVILLSGGFPVPNEVPASLRTALTLPVHTAAAYANKMLPADLQNASVSAALRAAVAYAEGDYAKALERVDALTQADRDAVAAQLARFTGLPLAEINRTTLRVSQDQISNTLLASRHLMIGHYDSRAVGPRDTTQTQYDPTTDPSLKDILDGVSVIHYLRDELGFRSDLFYQGPFGGGYPPPTSFRGDWMSTRWGRGSAAQAPPPQAVSAAGVPAAGRGGRGGGGLGVGSGGGAAASMASAPQALGSALTTDADLKVMVACGYYDLGGGCYASEYAARHLPPELARRVTARIYGGGHATYTDDTARKEMQADVAKFIQTAVMK